MSNKVRFTKPDWALTCLYGIGLVTTLIMGASNVFANLMASGIPAFLDDPWLAVALSALMPAGSIAIKLGSNVLEMPQHRKLYMQLVTCITGVLLLIWTYLFAKNYTGTAGALDLTSLMNPTAMGWVFIWVQTACELFVSATIFLALDKILEKYYPPKFIENPEWTCISKMYGDNQRVLEETAKRRAKLHGELALLVAKRQVFVDEKVADFLAARGRFNNRASL